MPEKKKKLPLWVLIMPFVIVPVGYALYCGIHVLWRGALPPYIPENVLIGPGVDGFSQIILTALAVPALFWVGCNLRRMPRGRRWWIYLALGLVLIIPLYVILFRSLGYVAAGTPGM